tara:strand:- start:422 stop:889 length:468 start_codon:yes stop_codon:yes gene_type:complete
MKTNHKLIYKRFPKKDADLLDISEIISQIKTIKYSTKTQNIKLLKSQLTEIFSNNGFILDIVLQGSNLKINGIKNNTGLALQTGNVARFYADVLKLQWLYEENKIKNAIYVCLSKEAQKESYLSNTIHIERALREIDFFDKIITLPILFISLDFT